MIAKLKENIQEYESALQDLSEIDIINKENDSFTINGNKLDELPGLENERIKVSNTFTHYIIERCNPRHVNILRRFVEEYEEKFDLLKNGLLDREEIENLKMVTVAIDLLFEIDVSYYITLSKMCSDGIISKVYDYFSENIDSELNYVQLCEAINRKGYGK